MELKPFFIKYFHLEYQQDMLNLKVFVESF